ncbi:hypothetical protein OJF2_62510 [Aquisphaera giovannonii]|uniref:Uncharacterized protein n=1 Tax=Aquisphaera giovannonii TaxID=406548 RepID=A0A5B9WCQ3_9BACT|nr:hypothetical protein [Aquisphaera giovannonii]QEH37660.1 hypothetical protein OJF2_62510 [Aquisphaera giovannonii]
MRSYQPSAGARCMLVFMTLTLAGPGARADDGPRGHAAVRLLGDMSTASLVLDTEPFAEWLKPVIAAAEARFPLAKGRKALVVQVTLRHDGPAVLEIAGNPAPSGEDVKAIEAAATQTSYRTKAASYSLRIVVKEKEGDPDDLPPLTPELRTPRERLLKRVAEAPTREGLQLLQRWAIDEALPLLAAAANGADRKFPGVRYLGGALSKALADPKKGLDVEKLATRNPDFWRATLEMERGNPLAPAVEMSLLLANGRVQWAQQIATMAGIFAGPSGASDVLGFGKALADAYLASLNGRIEKGIALYDSGKVEEALAAFDAILEDDPRSAWALYERFHTMRTIRMKKEGNLLSGGWAATRAKILASFPLYTSVAEASGQDGFFDLMRRKQLDHLFKEGRPVEKDLVTYADIALDLEAFDMAGLMYWSVLTSIRPEDYDNRPLLESFLYALERLGVRNIKGNFKGDHEAAFAAIEADRRRRVDAALKPDKKP